MINVNDIDSLVGKVELIDIRKSFEYKRGSVKTACNKLTNKGYEVVNVAGGVGSYIGTKRK